MLHLAAQQKNGLSTISTISNTWDIPESFLRKILNSLSKAGLISSVRGSGGGISLARPASKITLLDIFEAIEGKLYLNQCLIGPEHCDNRNWCPVHPVWREAQDAFAAALQKKSLADLVANPEFKAHFNLNEK